MKLISEHLGRVLVTLASMALVISIIVVSGAPITSFFKGIIDTTTEKAENMLDSIGGDTVTEINYPADFQSRLKPNVYYTAGKGYYSDFDITQHKITKENGLTVYVSPNGNDVNGGLSEDKPLKTINAALAVENVETVYLLEGTYNRGTGYTSPYPNIADVNLIGIGDVEINAGNSSGRHLYITGNAYIENIAFSTGTAVQITLSDADTVYFNKCEFSNMGSNGIAAAGGNYYLVECSAHDNKLDGFNYKKSSSGSLPNVVEIDCTAYNNGDGSDNSSNGSTIHDGASIVRINGEYHDCYGGVIADKGVSESVKSYSCNFGVNAYNSTITTAGYEDYNSSYWASNYCKMWLYDCQASDSTHSIHANYSSVVTVVSDNYDILNQSTYKANKSEIISSVS